MSRVEPDDERDGGGQRRHRHDSRRLGVILIACGLLATAYAAAAVLWRDPATDLYNRYQQQRLESAWENEYAAWRTPGSVESTAQKARRFEGQLELGDVFGRIRVPRMGLEAVVVNGTRWGADLSRGPGHFEETTVPGLGSTVGIAGHRTTFGAPFRHIDDLRRGDTIALEMPYATFRYRVFSHEIVDSDDWGVIRNRGFETIMLSACHPLYSASQRWIVYGRQVEVQPRTGPAGSIES
jgi:sortase A